MIGSVIGIVMKADRMILRPFITGSKKRGRFETGIVKNLYRGRPTKKKN
jgi:hypothetical protein